MSQSLVQVYLHVVFSTKNRAPFLKDPDLRQRLHAYIAGICNNLNCPSVRTGGAEDHVHILCRFGKGIELQDLLRDLKRDSSKWVKTAETRLADFHWQLGYVHFPSARRMSRTWWNTSRTRPSIIARKRSRMSFAVFARSMV